MVAVSFELQNGVYHVLQNFRAGDGAVFGNVPDQEYRNIRLLGEAQQISGTFSDLHYGARRAFYAVGIERLDGIDDE